MDQRHSLFAFPDSLALRWKLLPYALLLAVTFALYGATLYFHFVWDDFDYILENYRIQGHSPAHLRAIWRYPFSGQYAPLHHSLLAAIYSLVGLEPFAYHLVQLLLHAASVCMLYCVLKRIEGARVALLASLVFAVYPPNIETVAWVSETKSTLALLFFLISFRFFLRLRERERWADGIFSALFLFLALLSKINVVVAPVIFLLYDYRQGSAFKKNKIWSLAGFFLISIIFTGLTLSFSFPSIRAFPDRLIDAAIVDFQLPRLDQYGGYFGGISVHLLNLPRFIFFYAAMLFFPHPLSAWHMFRIYGELNWATGAAWIALIGLLWLLYRSPRTVQFWALWFLVFLAPVLQLIPNTIWVADRYLYVPAIGAFVLWSRLFFHIWERFGKLWPRLAWEAAMFAILLAFAWQTHHHLPPWQSDLQFWEATTETCMDSAYCHARLGRALLRDGHPDLAVREFLRAVRIRPGPQYFIYLGEAYADGLGDYPRALDAYRSAQQSAGSLPLFVWAKVAKVYYLAGNLPEAIRVIEDVRKMDPDDPSLLLVSGFVQWKQGDWENARQSLQRVLAANSLYPRSPNSAKFFNYYWGHPAEVGRLMADLGPL